MRSAMSDFIETNNFNKFSLDLNLGERGLLCISFFRLLSTILDSLSFPGFPAGLVKSKDLLKWGRIWTAGTATPDNVPYHMRSIGCEKE